MTEGSRPEQIRIVELDGLRGVAILFVLSFHYINNQLTQTSSSMGRYLMKATSFGWIGVDLFFVLSGFFIGSVLIRTKGSRNYFTTFYGRRIVRIIPNYYLLLVLFIILCTIPFFQSDKFLTGNRDIPLWSYFAMVHNIFMAHKVTLGTDSIDIVWSIGIEEQFYILLPLIIFFLKPRWLPWLLGVAFVAAPFFRMQYHQWIPPYVLLSCRMDALAAGVLIAYASIYGDLQAFTRKYFKWVIGVILIDIALCAFLFWKYSDLGAIRNSLFTVFFSGCVILALTWKDSFYGACLRNRLLVWIGTISYSLYLFHYMILGLLHKLSGQDAIGVYNLKGVIVSLAALFCSFVFAWFVYKKLETPFVKLGKKIRYN